MDEPNSPLSPENEPQNEIEPTPAAESGSTIEAENAMIESSMLVSVSATEDATIENSVGVVMAAGNDLHANNSVGSVWVAGNDLHLQQGGGALLIAGEQVHAEKSTIGVLLSGEPVNLGEGSKILLDTRQAAVLGAAFGIVFALMSYLLRRFGRK